MDVNSSKNEAKPFCTTLLSAPFEKIKQIFKEMLNCSKISFESIVGCRSLSPCFKCFVEFDFHNHRRTAYMYVCYGYNLFRRSFPGLISSSKQFGVCKYHSLIRIEHLFLWKYDLSTKS